MVGSGIMAERALLGPSSGAHFNPAVSLVQALRGRLSWGDMFAYALVQIAGCCAGALLAHVMFELPVMQASLHVRTGVPQWIAESVATFGLLLVVLGHRRPEDAPWMVSAWIRAAYWFTASTSFANPAITLARSMQGPHSRRANSRKTLRPARCAVRPECPGGYGEPPWLS